MFWVKVFNAYDDPAIYWWDITNVPSMSMANPISYYCCAVNLIWVLLESIVSRVYYILEICINNKSTVN